MENDEIKAVIKEISESMKDKGYDPVTQIVGYLISNDLGYIPDFDDNRNKIATLDRTLLVESMLREYLK
ncbi:MAG: IreB family regulatory phosphoprotein [Bacilli bacterium]|nr:IreB family regulatory phosphoprotein [Bacilli bacterium]